ncbi:hypothetical protein COCSUDRAFT_47905 [Coccomyxa subellipsoidea C-169]|uniref:Uncharacterized protein n=1 Tax=Coccomyxa subellipsoidea (strain C-169) TaxID=574566 RepID=I0YVR3_COCSC|nr:hypothetical protein COCSUDRAFT_47905 [Coccomyxa subellipsoidea C-169]EIE22482.1 hypothetical protein COCSUDRAFT_47905 [Coccomyxa subellipsoidea C-169]|eukprot:XP_005647026.1 hypothetical protein COCSUDRAFT_47905 [Coccomyxa subellipsoidea C-169]
MKMPEDSSRACGCGSLLAHAALALSIAGAVLFCSQAFAQLNAIQQLTGILHGAKGSWTVAYKAAVIATTAVAPVLALLSSCLVRILVTCKMDMILAKEGCQNVSVRRAQLMLARVLCVLLILTSAWLVLLGALQTTGIIFTLNMKAMAAASGDTDTAASQHCFDFALFQHRSHICDPGSIQRIADILGSALIFACLAAGGLLLMGLGCQTFMCQSCEVAAVTSLLIRRALHLNEEQADALNQMEMQVPGSIRNVCSVQNANPFPAASAPSWPPQH